MLIFIDVAAGVDNIIFRMLQAGIIAKAVERIFRAVKSIFPAIYGAAEIKDVSALGIIESYDASSIIVAADEAAKTAIVDLIEVRLARGMCGKSYLMLTGEVAAVEAAIDRAKEAVSDDGMYLDSAVIAHPDAQIRDAIL